MIVRGWLHDGAPYVAAKIRAKSIQGSFSMLVDTGAFATVLLDRDVLSLRLDLSALGRAALPIAGIGGSVPTYVLREAEIVLPSDEGQIVFLQDLYLAHHDLRHASPARVRGILRLPSLLGRDILQSFRFVYEHAAGTVLLER